MLLSAAHALGALARRFGQPPVVGALAAGLLLSPSVLGAVSPDAYGWLFPDDPRQQGLPEKGDGPRSDLGVDSGDTPRRVCP